MADFIDDNFSSSIWPVGCEGQCVTPSNMGLGIDLSL